MLHSIIIPHRNRNENLRWCLWSIERSAQATGISDYQVLVIDAGSRVEPEPPTCGLVRHDKRHGRLFNKSRLFNIGLALSREAGGAVTFLDADAIVGRRWLAGIKCLDSPSLTRLCYRVRFVNVDEFKVLDHSPSQAELVVNGWFVGYGRYTCAGELYGTPDGIYEGPVPPAPFGPHVFGNSQFSIRRDVLGDLRYNDAFEGRGREDQWFIREIWRRAGEDYCAALLTDSDFAMFHVHDPKPMTEEDDWDNPTAYQRNVELYETT